MVSMDKDVSDIIKDIMTTNSTKDGLGFLVCKFKSGYLVEKNSLLFKKCDGVQSIPVGIIYLELHRLCLGTECLVSGFGSHFGGRLLVLYFYIH